MFRRDFCFHKTSYPEWRSDTYSFINGRVYLQNTAIYYTFS